MHQCNASSTDAWWDLALSYAQAVDVAGGIAVPPTGLTLTMRVLSQSGEWSALSTVNVRGELPQSSVADGLRLAEALTSADGDDTLDYLVVTNVAAGEIHLDGVKIVAWNAKKKSEADPSLTYFFPAGTSLGAGESLRIDAASFPAGGKLTNSQVGLRIYAAGGALVQDVYLDADWWNGACDGTGEYFVAKTFGAEAKTISDWKPSATTLVDSLRVLELYTSTAGDGGDTGEFIVLTNLDASAALDLTDVKIVAWNSKKKSEADPSLVITLDGVAIPAGGTLTLAQATYFGTDNKLTNSKVGLKIYDPAEACAQEVEVDAGWWSSACDGTGAHFIALDFDQTVKTVSQWRPSFMPPADATGQNSVKAAIATNDLVRGWMNELGSTTEGQAIITAFAGTEDQVAKLSFTKIAIAPDGSIVLGGDLKVLGVEWRKKVGGTLKLYRYKTLGGEPDDVVDLDLENGVFPLNEANGGNVNATANERYNFFRLVLE